MNICVILPAAGLGQRFEVGPALAGDAQAIPRGASGKTSGGNFGGVSGGVSKIEFEIEYKPVFLHAIEAFRAAADVGQIILAVHPERVEDFRFRWEDKLRFLGVTLIAGGTQERWETVQLALEKVQAGATHIAVHDAARPVVSPKMIERIFAAAERLPAVAPGLPVSSTLKRVASASTTRPPVAADPLEAILGSENSPIAEAKPVLETVSRENLVAIQTPQVFEIDLLRRAYANAAHVPKEKNTDDAGLVEALGETVHVVEGDPGNIKITCPGDVELAAALLAHRKQAGATKKAVDLFGDDDD